MQIHEITRDFVGILNKRLAKPLNFIQVVLGPRQVGKTTGLRQIFDRWDAPKHFASADSVSPPTSHWIEIQWKKARSMGENVLLVLDEIQKIPNWSEVVKHLFDEDRTSKKIKVVLLGSASLSLQKGLSESLAGRYELIKVYHWSFEECQKAFNWSIDDYLIFGGYPASAELINDWARWQSFIHESIIEAVLFKDIQGIAQVRKPALFRQTFELALQYPAQEISYQKLLGQLQDRGNATTIKHYLELFEGALLIKTLGKYATKPVKTRTSSPKILPLTTALVTALSGKKCLELDSEYKGRLFECAVGARLHQLDGKLFYWRDGKFEVDYVLETSDKLMAIEVKSGRKKKYHGLGVFLEQYPQAIPVMLDLKQGEEFLLSGNLS